MMNCQESLRSVYDALVNYEPKRLSPYGLADCYGNHCAIGVWYSKQPGATVEMIGIENQTQRENEIYNWTSNKMGFQLMYRIFDENDKFKGTEEGRYHHMVQWLKGQIGLIEVDGLHTEANVMVNANA